MNDKKIKKNTKTTSIGTSITYSKKNTGITLIALVITVIVLLILARSRYKPNYRRKWYTKKNNNRSRNMG